MILHLHDFVKTPSYFGPAPSYFGPAPREIRNRQKIWQDTAAVDGGRIP
ncbi:hypothetical protein [Breoghania sp.]|nr:hypothetical protein [Breoghania sp.]MDJ0933475.1 hypothetical protein [Breoghania sp.]